MWYVMCSTAGQKLILDNSTSPNSNLGPHTRVSWSVDTTALTPNTAAVALALSSDNLFSLRMVAFKLFRTRVDANSGVAASVTRTCVCINGSVSEFQQH